jgi:hypothetical protein
LRIFPQPDYPGPDHLVSDALVRDGPVLVRTGSIWVQFRFGSSPVHCDGENLARIGAVGLPRPGAFAWLPEAWALIRP